jgi:hypothetical protein
MKTKTIASRSLAQIGERMTLEEALDRIRVITATMSENVEELDEQIADVSPMRETVEELGTQICDIEALIAPIEAATKGRKRAKNPLAKTRSH